MAQIIKDPAPIHQALKVMGLRQRHLAKALGLNDSQISLTLAGKREIDLHELIKIAELIAVPWTSLLPTIGIADPTATDVPPEAWDRAEFDELRIRVEHLECIVRGIGNVAVHSAWARK